MPARVTHQSIMMVTLSFTFAAAFNNTVCPAPWELQSPRMRTFQLDQLAGMYLELALHDVTQYPLCPSKPRCISSNKTIARHADGTRFVYDEWNLSCMGSYWPQTLLFNETNITGHLLGYVPVTQIPFLPPSVVGSVVFPDTIVDFKPGANGWAVEFQCVQNSGMSSLWASTFMLGAPLKRCTLRCLPRPGRAASTTTPIKTLAYTTSAKTIAQVHRKAVEWPRWLAAGARGGSTADGRSHWVEKGVSGDFASFCEQVTPELYASLPSCRKCEIRAPIVAW